MTDLAGIDFSASMRDAQAGLLLKPILHNYLFDAKFPDYSIDFINHEMEREPDGWFHPSTHPLWHPRVLYQYLSQPHLMRIEKKEYMGTLSVTIGTAMHGFVQMCLEDAGVLPKALQVCTVCDPALPLHEPGVIDEDAGERGHMDGLLDFSSLSVVSRELESPVFEFKTSNLMKLAKLHDMDLEHYKKTWPDYYAQNQSYMRMSGRRMVVVLFLGMGYPWDMKEVHVPYDAGFSQQVRQKYLDVRQAVADQRPLAQCCGSTKTCPAGRICLTAAEDTTPATGRMLAL